MKVCYFILNSLSTFLKHKLKPEKIYKKRNNKNFEKILKNYRIYEKDV